jgi:sugar lactone lactonase YvrE
MKRARVATGWTVRLPALGLAVLAAAVVVVTATAAGGTVASGLANPRGITTGPGGRLLVVESASGAIDELRKGSSRTIATVPGAVDVATNGLGNTYAVVGSPEPDAPPPPAGSNPASLVRISPNGNVEVVADIGAYQVTHPDEDDLDQPPNPSESNPNGLALLPGGNVLVADAAANDLLRVDVHGQITTVAHFKPEFVTWALPFGPPIGTTVPAEAVPTAVAVGPDGAYYVSELTGFPFTKGAARIWRIAPGSVEAVCDPVAPSGGCSSVATGFSSVISLTFGPDGTMYVLELAKEGLAGALVLRTEFPPTGALWAVKNGVRTLISDELTAPGGVAVDPSGRIFVTTLTFGPPGGSVISLNG